MTAPKAKPRAASKAKRPAGLAHGRWLGDFEEEQPLSAAETALVSACAKGERWEPEGWDGKRPEKATPVNTIRAGLIRFLLLGGDGGHPVHEEGVMLWGAWITGTLNLHQARAIARFDARKCHFALLPVFKQASLPELALIGCQCPGLNADQLTVAGDVFLGDGFCAKGELRLKGAKIGGALDCGRGRFVNKDGDALNAEQLKLTGSLFLCDQFHATGEVRLSGAVIGGDLDCIGGRFENAKNEALNIQGATVKQGLILRGASFEGAIQLITASVSTLIDGDDLSCWQRGLHFLDGFRYEQIIGFTDAARRIEWLNLQQGSELTTGFAPQPWEHLIKVLREMGHPADASAVAVAKQEQMRVAGVIKGPVRRPLHWLYGLLAGYGHHPLRTVAAMFWVWLACAFFFQIGGSQGYFGPTTPLLNNPQLAAIVEQHCGHRWETKKQVWTACSKLPAEYTTFQPLMYSADLILPLVNLQQEADWAPIVSVPTNENMGFGVFLRWLMWFEILFGWAMSLMLVAVLGRLVDKD